MSKQILSDLDFNNASRILNLPNPSAPQEPATKAYVDEAVEGLAWKDSARVATTANLNLAAPGASIDGVSLTANDRVLVKNQTTTNQNGIYIWNGAATPATRALDANTFPELEQAIITVEEGTSAGATFRQTEVNGTLGTSPILFVNFGTAAPAATESTPGIAEIATQGETNTGTDDARFVTPLKLANWSGRSRKFTQNIGDGAATSYNVDHNFATREVHVEVFRNSGNYDTILCDVNRPTTNRVTLVFATAPAINAFSVVVIG